MDVLISQFHAHPTVPSDFSDESTDEGKHQRRVLALAESTLYRIETGDWSYTNFPTPEVAAAQSGALPEEIREAQEHLARRNLLTWQEDPHSRQQRLLPPPVVPRPDAAQRIADKIALRISLRIWCGHNFPTIVTIVEEFGCGSKTLCRAFKLLHEQGLVHKVNAFNPGRARRGRAWRPVDVASQESHYIIHRLEAALRAGEVVGMLPRKGDMTRRCHVAPRVIRAGYNYLERQGLITKGWPRHSKSPVWFATSSGVPPGVTPGTTRTLAVAAAIIRAIPDWLVRHPDGTWSRVLIPIKHTFVRELNADFDTVERAWVLLVELHILERAPTGAQRYFPRPPADLGAAHGLTFPTVAHVKRPWAPAGDPVQWLPLPLPLTDEEPQDPDTGAQEELDDED